MSEADNLVGALEKILDVYRQSFSAKVYDEENDDHDLLMDLFGISPELKRENRQYWGRELGMCWQLLVSQLFKLTRVDHGPALRIGADEPCDFTFGKTAVDTKYRIGSGDSGTLKKFKQYGPLLRSKGFEPVFLIVRNDNLGAAITACRAGGWDVRTGDATFAFVKAHTKFDLKAFLIERGLKFRIDRK
jgi:hypothetical protein